MYRVRSSSDPEKVVVEKESDHFVWINGRRNSKKSDYEAFFDTIDECKDWLVSIASVKLAKAESQLKYYQGQMDDILHKIKSW